jgi:hypothetical protein
MQVRLFVGGLIWQLSPFRYFVMWVDRGLFCGLFVELADLGFAVTGYFEEALGEFDGGVFGLGLDESEASDDLFGFGEGAVGDGVLAADVADARTEGGWEAAFGGEQKALFNGLLDEFAHRFHCLRGGRGAFFCGGLVDA